MIEPYPDDIGRLVIYRDLGAGRIEEGRMTSYNHHYVFVRFSGGTSQACNRRDLEWSYRLPDETAVRTDMRDGRVVRIDFCIPPTN